ncbi:hypothetical protein D3C85_1815130 [compost metagenome]
MFEDYTLVVSDRDKAVMGMVDVNGHPVVPEVNEFIDKDTKYIASEAQKDDKKY